MRQLSYIWEIYLTAIILIIAVSIIGNAPSPIKIGIWGLAVLITSILLLLQKSKSIYIFIFVGIISSSLLSIDYTWFNFFSNAKPNPYILFNTIIATLCFPFFLRAKSFNFNFLEKITIFYYFLFLMSLVWGINSMSVFIYFYIFIAAFLFLSLLIKSQIWSLAKIFHTCLLAISLINAISLIQYFLGANINYSTDFGLESERLFGLWGSINPNRLAALLIVAIIISIHSILKKRNFWLVLNLTLLFISMVLIYSRTGFIACFITILTYLSFRKRFSFKSLLTIVLVVIILFVFSDTILSFLQRGGSDTSSIETMSFRTIIWAEILQNISQNINQTIVGYGVSKNSIINNLSIPVSHAHNGYLQIIVETGIIGITTFGTILIFLTRKLIKLARQNSDYSVLFGILISIIVFNITEPISAGVYFHMILILQLIILIAANPHQFLSSEYKKGLIIDTK